MLNLVWWNLDPGECYEREWLRELLADCDVREITDPRLAPRGEDVIFIANFSKFVFGGLRSAMLHRAEQSRLRHTIRAWRAAGRRVGLLHLGDELYADSTACYGDVDFVFRQYFRAEEHARFKRCHYLPLGYSAGFTAAANHRPMRARTHSWCFAGQARKTRRAMIQTAVGIPGGNIHCTERWADPSGLDTKAYADLMSNSRFALCPAGNCSVDCLRVYEALEAGAIPIVETHGLGQCFASFFSPRRLLKHGIRDQRFWSRNHNYWERAFPAGFPCPQIRRWCDLPGIIEAADPEAMSERIQQWWASYKSSLKHLVRTTIEDAFS